MGSEPKKAAAQGKKKERKRGRWCKKVDPMAEFEKHSSDEEEEEEEDPVAPPAKTQKLMGMPLSLRLLHLSPRYPQANCSSFQTTSAPKRSTRNIPAAKKNKAPVSETVDEE